MPFDSNGIFSLNPGYNAVVGQIIQPSQHNPPLEDISTNGLSNVLVRDGRAAMTGNLNMGGFRARNALDGVLSTDLATKGQLDGRTIRGYLYGLTLSNDTLDATNDVVIAAGSAATDDVAPQFMTLAAAMTKRTDAAWAVGSGGGGWLDGASMPNGTGHAFLIQRSDTGVVDVGFSASATAPPLPTNYDRKRRIGSILRESATIIPFKQTGDVFRRTAKTDRSSTAAFASQLFAVSVPTGIAVFPLFAVDMSTGTVSTDANFNLGGAWEGSAANTVVRVFTTSLANTAGAAHSIVPPDFETNTSAQIYASVVVNSGALSAFVLATVGWIDTRGTI